MKQCFFEKTLTIKPEQGLKASSFVQQGLCNKQTFNPDHYPGINKQLKLRKLENARSRLAEFEKEPAPVGFRVVPITPQLSGKILSYCLDNGIRPDERLFRISRVRAYQVLQIACVKRAGVKRIGHILRYSGMGLP